MLKYGKKIIFDPEKLDPLNIDRQSINLIPNGVSVLDIGCATGFMGKYLKNKKRCRVVGVEFGEDEVKVAKKNLDRVVTGDIEDERTLSQIKEKFDVILASAIIEHLKDPEKALSSWKKFLARNGRLIVTTSNIAHWSQRLELIRGRFEYKDYGILDNTHLHFYTIDTFKKLIESAGYKIDYFSIDPVGGGFPRISEIMSRFFSNLFAYQMLVLASPAHANSPNKKSANLSKW